MVVVCKLTKMAIKYFTLLAKKRENLPLIQNLVKWLVKRYNLHIKVIRSANKMNQIKTIE